MTQVSELSATGSAAELSDEQLAAVTGGDDKAKSDTKAKNTKGDQNPYSLSPVVISIIGVLIS
jgi:bacteriocin-like protein